MGWLYGEWRTFVHKLYCFWDGYVYKFTFKFEIIVIPIVLWFLWSYLIATDWVPARAGQAVRRTRWFALGGGGAVTKIVSQVRRNWATRYSFSVSLGQTGKTGQSTLPIRYGLLKMNQQGNLIPFKISWCLVLNATNGTQFWLLYKDLCSDKVSLVGCPGNHFPDFYLSSKPKFYATKWNDFWKPISTHIIQHKTSNLSAI